jgi:hypothetical protein
MIAMTDIAFRRPRSRSWLELTLVTSVWLSACATLAGVDDDYFEDISQGGASTAGAGGTGGSGTAGNGGNGTAGNGGNGTAGSGGNGGTGTVPLGDPCSSTPDCMTGECCTDLACIDTCMVPCIDIGDCPQPSSMVCQHGYCLFACTVDVDCTQTDFVCHHMCIACEKKASQGCN